MKLVALQRLMVKIDIAAHGQPSMTMAGLGYPRVMRYADGGGLSERGRVTREQVQLQAAEWFAQDMPVGEIARRLRVSTNAVYTRRRRWRAEGEAGSGSKGPGGSSCRLDERRLDRLAEALERGPAAHGFGDDQRWTLARVSDLIARLFHTRYTPRGVSYLLHSMGFSPQVPAHRAVERDEKAIVTWRRETLCLPTTSSMQVEDARSPRPPVLAARLPSAATSTSTA